MDSIDMIAQLLMFIFFIAMFLIPFLLYRFFGKQENKSNNIEQKLDRIIELLEQNKKE